MAFHVTWYCNVIGHFEYIKRSIQKRISIKLFCIFILQNNHKKIGFLSDPDLKTVFQTSFGSIFGKKKLYFD